MDEETKYASAYHGRQLEAQEKSRRQLEAVLMSFTYVHRAPPGIPCGTGRLELSSQKTKVRVGVSRPAAEGPGKKVDDSLKQSLWALRTCIALRRAFTVAWGDRLAKYVEHHRVTYCSMEPDRRKFTASCLERKLHGGLSSEFLLPSLLFQMSSLDGLHCVSVELVLGSVDTV
jgi:hypothetical protein